MTTSPTPPHIQSTEPAVRRTIVLSGPVPPPYYGSCIALEQLLHGAPPAGYRLRHVDATRSRPDPTGRIASEKLRRDAANLAKLRGIIRDTNADVYYWMLSQVPLGLVRDALAATLASPTGAKLVAHLHGGSFRSVYESLNPLTRAITRSMLHRLDAAIVLSESLREQFRGLIPEDRIHVVHNGVPEDVVSPSELRAADARRRNAGTLRIIFLSNLFEKKGYRELLEACALLSQRGVPFRTTFAGGWERPGQEAEILELTQRLGIAQLCTFAGVVSGRNKYEQLLNSDVFVLPTSFDEGQPLSIIEAFAAGLPVIATARGGIPDMVTNNVEGILLDTANPATIAERLATLASDPELRLAMGTSARARYQADFTETAYLRGMYRVFDHVLVGV